MDERDIALIDELRSDIGESSYVEFKKDNSNHEMIGKLCSALSNGARIDGIDFAYIIWGIDDETRKIIGTSFDYDNKKVGNEVFQFWLAKKLKPSIAFSFRGIDHPDGSVILLEIPAATTSPVEYSGVSYVRIGSSTPKLTDYPERFKKLMDNIRSFSWEKCVAKSFVTGDDVLSLLDYPSYFSLTKQPLPDNRWGIFEKLEADRLIIKDVGDKWNITNLGAILFAINLSKFDSSISRKSVRLVSYSGINKASPVRQRIDGQRGYASGFESLLSFVNSLLPKNEYIGVAFRNEKSLFPEIAIRELIANALIHQDMTITGTGPQIELFSDRIEIVNPGKPLVQVDRMIDLPPRSRNEMLASLMRRMSICEEQGSGLDKVIVNIELYQLPPPIFHSGNDSMQVVLLAPKSFAKMSPTERVRACYQHSVIKYISGDRLKNSSLCKRFGLDSKNAAQISRVINKALTSEKIKVADPEYPRAGYVPFWA